MLNYYITQIYFCQLFNEIFFIIFLHSLLTRKKTRLPRCARNDGGSIRQDCHAGARNDMQVLRLQGQSHTNKKSPTTHRVRRTLRGVVYGGFRYLSFIDRFYFVFVSFTLTMPKANYLPPSPLPPSSGFSGAT